MWLFSKMWCVYDLWNHIVNSLRACSACRLWNPSWNGKIKSLCKGKRTKPCYLTSLRTIHFRVALMSSLDAPRSSSYGEAWWRWPGSSTSLWQIMALGRLLEILQLHWCSMWCTSWSRNRKGWEVPTPHFTLSPSFSLWKKNIKKTQVMIGQPKSHKLDLNLQNFPFHLLPSPFHFFFVTARCVTHPCPNQNNDRNGAPRHVRNRWCPLHDHVWRSRSRVPQEFLGCYDVFPLFWSRSKVYKVLIKNYWTCMIYCHISV